MNVAAPVKTGTRGGKGTTPRPLPAPNSDFYDLYGTLKPEELAIVKRRARVHGGQGRARHHEVLVRRLVSLRAVAGRQRVGRRRDWT